MTSLILPAADTTAMNLFLAHVADVFATYFIVMQVDQAVCWLLRTSVQKLASCTR
jgi:hypothetical protein